MFVLTPPSPDVGHVTERGSRAELSNAPSSQSSKAMQANGSGNGTGFIYTYIHCKYDGT